MLAQAREANADAANVTWIHGDGTTLTGIDDGSVDGVFSWVVLQHVPEPEIVLGYIEEMGRVLKPHGWAAFQVSTDPNVHQPRGIAERAKQALGKGPKGQADPAWLGTAVDPADLRATVLDSGLRVKQLLNEGTQFCLVHAIKD
jgi:SAM-dependent methyltransferase